MSHHQPINQTVDPPGSLPCKANPDSEPPLAELLRNSGKQRKELAREIGYRNLGKGMNLLREIERGAALVPDSVVPAFATALGVSPDSIRQANARTLDLARAQDDRARRLTFRPHIVWIPERERVTPMFLGLMILKPVYLPPDLDDAQRVALAMQLRPESLPMWGAVRGFWINHSPDRATAHDLHGAVVAEREAMVERRAWLALRC